jgi:hypothetical protein
MDRMSESFGFTFHLFLPWSVIERTESASEELAKTSSCFPHDPWNNQVILKRGLDFEGFGRF